ncbi:hypothetical protein PCASD_11183 [Puccinia coronata f. sp. avenae]|uniref:Uncharacterized protein n=1 Tax=Puccinia coronata f. sp. avenae TaxID=200324 RepID=A0A2N5UFE4_9BASI|nr:hypothetical protein PCASD_11183 [Puccinia coronata f. sp. avenae]
MVQTSLPSAVLLEVNRRTVPRPPNSGRFLHRPEVRPLVVRRSPWCIQILVAHICFLSWDQQGQLVGRQPVPTVSAQTVSQDQQSGLEEFQQQSELADCQPKPLVLAESLPAGTIGLSWKTVI